MALQLLADVTLAATPDVQRLHVALPILADATRVVLLPLVALLSPVVATPVVLLSLAADVLRLATPVAVAVAFWPSCSAVTPVVVANPLVVHQHPADATLDVTPVAMQVANPLVALLRAVLLLPLLLLTRQLRCLPLPWQHLSKLLLPYRQLPLWIRRLRSSVLSC